MAYVAPTELPYRRGSLSWRITREPALGLGGGRALLLQVAHPKVGAGVEQHSSYQDDPFGRLFRTADVVMKLTLAEPEVGRRQANVLRGRHARVKGTTPAGAPYRALHPDLLVWVWATLVDTSLVVYQRLVAPLSRIDQERFYDEQKLFAYACGVPEGHCPPRLSDLAELVDATVAHELEATSEARLVTAAISHPPLPKPLGALAGGLTAFVTAGLLPARLRQLLGLTWTRRQARALDAFSRAHRLATRLVPAPLRTAPIDVLVQRDKPLVVPGLSGRPLQLPAAS